jgi:hypothetical protein
MAAGSPNADRPELLRNLSGINPALLGERSQAKYEVNDGLISLFYHRKVFV